MSIPTQVRDLTVTTTPTQADAQLLVQLGQLAAAMQVDQGTALLRKHHRAGGLTAETFAAEYADDDPSRVAIVNVMKWHETVGTLVKNGLLSQALVLDWLWVAGTWEMCRPIALAQRDEAGVAQIWENFEALAAAQQG